MNFTQSFRLAVKSLVTSKMRALLTMLGIIIGVAAVLVLVALVSGYNADITAYYEKLGVNKVNVSVTWYDRTRAVDVYSALYGYGNTTLGDMVEGVSPSASTSLPVKYRSATLESSTVYLGSDQFAVCGNYVLESGRDISEFDIQRRSKSASWAPMWPTPSFPTPTPSARPLPWGASLSPWWVPTTRRTADRRTPWTTCSLSPTAWTVSSSRPPM